MQLQIFVEHRFHRTPDGRVWTQTAYAYPDWRPHLKVFDSVNVVARVEEVSGVDSDMQLASGPAVSFTAVPYFIGPLQFLLKAGAVRRAVRKTLKRNTAVLLRIPGIIGGVAYQVLKTTGQPYAAQILGDPYEVFSPGAVRHPLRPLFRWWFTKQLEAETRSAAVVSYVTRFALQKRYPSPASFSNFFSDVKLLEHSYVKRPRTDWDILGTAQRPCRMVLVGSLAQMYKSPDIVLQALALCTEQQLYLHLTILGDGKHRAELEALACDLKVRDQVTFVGQLSSGDAVVDQLDKADLFVLPSRTEGLPRAMIEAMARGLPCIGSRVGGIPELLADEDLVPPGDASALAQALQEVITSPQRLREMSRRNLETAHSYAESVMEERRQAFFESLKTVTHHWQAEKDTPKSQQTEIKS